MNTRADRWHLISDLFDRVVDLSPAERERVLSAECADDPALRVEVQRLLSADERTSPVDRDIAAQASQLLLEGDPHEHEGQLFGPYRIVKLLGQGGMGRVYLAEREGEDFTQTVALKVVGGYGSFDAATARRRFLDERRILARLQHPHIARLLDGGVGPEAQPWFAMEYVDGAPLTQWCDDRKWSIRERLTLFAKICDAVDHAHRFLIVHRDLKPGNVLVDAQGEPKVLDFGIAKLLDEGAQDRTGSTILMTPDYAAPEQIRGGQISTATDVYALGAVLFEVLTGRKPFSDPLAPREPPQASRAATEASESTGERAASRATTPQALRKSLRGDIDRILRTALDPDPARRYRSAASLAEDLRAVADGRAISLRSDTAYRMRVFLRQHRLSTSIVAAAALALVGTTGWALWQQEQAFRQARIANKETRTANSVKTLVTDMFSSVSPEVSLGETITVKQMLDKNQAVLFRTLKQEPSVAVEVLVVMAKSYAALGNHKQAWELLDRALPLVSEVDTERRAELFVARLGLAQVQGSLDAIRKEAGALRPLVEGIKDPGLKVAALLALSDYWEIVGVDGKELSEEALRLARKSFPPGDLRRLRAMRVLAAAEGSNANIGRTEQLLIDGLREAEQYLPPNHPEITSQRRALIGLYGETNRFELAVPHARRALSETIAVYGENGLLVAADRLWVSRILINAGDYRGARAELAKALDTYVASSGELSLQRASTEKLLGNVEEALGNYLEAEDLYKRSLSRYMRTTREKFSIPHMRMNVARVMLKRGDAEGAAAIYREVLAEPDNQTAALAVARAGLGSVARMSNDTPGALALHRQALKETENEKKVDRYAKLRSLSVRLELARDHAALGDAHDSAEILRSIISEIDAKFPFDSPDLADAYRALGEQLVAEGSTQEGRRLMARYAELQAVMKGVAPPKKRES